MRTHEYTGPHDYFDEEYVRYWEGIANFRRPFRIEFFDAFVNAIKQLTWPTVLDLGSGPGFLAEHVLTRCNIQSYYLFDFSPHMLKLSRARLAGFAERVLFHEGSFLDDEWWKPLPQFDVVVSMQAVHEARSGERIRRLYRELGCVLNDDGLVLIADAVNDSDQGHRMNEAEHEAALADAGFHRVRRILEADDLVMFEGVKARAASSDVAKK